MLESLSLALPNRLHLDPLYGPVPDSSVSAGGCLFRHVLEMLGRNFRFPVQHNTTHQQRRELEAPWNLEWRRYRHIRCWPGFWPLHRRSYLYAWYRNWVRLSPVVCIGCHCHHRCHPMLVARRDGGFWREWRL